MIIRYHTAYHAGSDEKIGIQVRVYSRHPSHIIRELFETNPHVLSTADPFGLLPEISINGTLYPTRSKMKSKAVLINFSLL
jgi:Xyloglucan fucosyltransferase